MTYDEKLQALDKSNKTFSIDCSPNIINVGIHDARYLPFHGVASLKEAIDWLYEQTVGKND